MDELYTYEPEPFCDFCGRTAEQVRQEEGRNYIIVSQRNRHAAICTICVAGIVDAVIAKAQEDGVLEDDE